MKRQGTTITKETSHKIRNMSFVCALLVVSIHINWHADESRVLWWGFQLICEGVARVAVPFFFVVSGYFLAAHFEEQGWWKKETLKRVKSLIVPYFIWAAIGAIAMAPMSIIADSIAHRPFGANLHLGVCDLLGFKIKIGPIWYLRCLFMFVLMSPLIRNCATRARWLWFALVAISYGIHFWLFYPSPDKTAFLCLFRHVISLEGLLYFSAGLLLHSSKTLLEGKKSALLVACAALSLVSAKVILAWNGCRGTFMFNLVLIPLLLYVVFYFMPSKPGPKWLVSCSFQIFLMHMIFVRYTSAFLKYVPIFNLWMQTLICWAFGVAGPILSTIILRRFFPRFACVLFGGR